MVWDNLSIDELIINLLSGDTANATQACRDLKHILNDSSRVASHPRIREALSDAADMYGSAVCEQWAGMD